jgi:putative FmdB family regulatory protein
MPIYEYVCDSCGYDFERIQSFSAEPVQTCPECGGVVRRVISPVGVIFKGSGWYITDSKRQITDGGKRGGAKDKDKDKGTDAGNGKAAEKADKAESDPKPAAKSEPAGKAEPSA